MEPRIKRAIIICLAAFSILSVFSSDVCSYTHDTYPIEIPASLFEKDQVYTWVLRQVFFNGEKSDPGFSSFKIIKK